MSEKSLYTQQNKLTRSSLGRSSMGAKDRRTKRLLLNMIKAILKFLILGLRPLLGPAVCKYEVGCTQYAINQLEKESLVKAIWLIIKRVISCW